MISMTQFLQSELMRFRHKSSVVTLLLILCKIVYNIKGETNESKKDNREKIGKKWVCS